MPVPQFDDGISARRLAEAIGEHARQKRVIEAPKNKAGCGDADEAGLPLVSEMNR